jgi:hypothetical protein
MKRSLVVSVALITLVGLALAGPGGADGDAAGKSDQRESAAEGRLYLLFTETESGVRVSPADPDAKLKEGQYRVSCKSFTFEWREQRPVLVFFDVVMESEEGRIAGTKAIHYLKPRGARKVEGSVWIQPVKRDWEHMLRRQQESIERGMKASELQHRQRWESRLRGTKASGWENRPRHRLPFEGHQERNPR